MVVQWHILGVVGSMARVSFVISWRLRQWTNFENQPTVAKVWNGCRVACFYWRTV